MSAVGDQKSPESVYNVRILSWLVSSCSLNDMDARTNFSNGAMPGKENICRNVLRCFLRDLCFIISFPACTRADAPGEHPGHEQGQSVEFLKGLTGS